MARRKRMTHNDLSFYFGEVVRVTWEDIATYDKVRTKDIVKEAPLQFETYGKCTSETKTALFVAHTLPTNRKDKRLREDIVRIPKRSIDFITIFKEDY